MESRRGSRASRGTGRTGRVRPGWLTHGVVLALCWLGLTNSPAQTPEDFRLTSEIRNARARLQWERRDLPPVELDVLAEFIGRSNYLANAIANAFRINNLTNVEEWVKRFPGKLDDVRDFGQPLLYRAAQGGNDTQLIFLLEHQANPDVQAMNGETPLSAAISSRHWLAAVRLVEAGASVTNLNSQGQPPLAQLVNGWWSWGTPSDAQAAVLELMLEHGADPFAPCSKGANRSIVEQALSMRLDDPAEQLLTNRPSPARLTPDGDTALHLAARWGLTNAIESLIHAGFSVELTNTDGLTSLQCIADSADESGGQRMVGTRVRFGFGPGRGGNTPPPTPRDVVELLLRHGARLDVFSAAGLGKTNELAAMLRANPGLANARDGLGRTPLHYAISGATQPNFLGMGPTVWGIRGPPVMPGPPSTRTNQIDAARLLLQAGANPAAATTKLVPSAHRDQPGLPAGTTPLHVAAARGNDNMIQALLAAGAPVAVADGAGDTPLHMAARFWLTKCAVRLLAAHAPLDVTNGASRTPLRAAVESRVSANVLILLNAGARPNVGLGRDTLMHIAAENGDTATLGILLAHHQPLEPRDRTGATPFHRAATAHQRDALDWLRLKGADVNATDLRRNTALHLLAAQQNEDVFHPIPQAWWVRWMQRAFYSAGFGRKALTALIKAKIISQPPSPAYTNTSLSAWLVDHGAKAGLTNYLGQTPLHVLCGQQWATYDTQRASNRLALLLRADPRLDRVDVRGRTPLQIALTNLAPELVSWLLSRGGNLDGFRDPQGRPLLHGVVASMDIGNSQRCQEIIRVLLQRHADPNGQDAEGLTALHLAMRMGAGNFGLPLREVVSMLLTNGANPNLADKQGRTPLHVLAASTDPSAHPGDRLGDVLLDKRWNFAARDQSGQTPVHLWAAGLQTGCGNCAAFFQSVLTNGGLVDLTNAAGDTALHIAMRAHRDQTIPLLLEAGADPGQRNRRGETCFRLAAINNLVYPCRKSSTPAPTTQGFFNALYSRDETGFGHWLDADPSLCDLTNADGVTPLAAATARDLTKTTQRLLTLGAPVDLLSAMRLDRWDDFERQLPQANGRIPADWLFEAVARGKPQAVEAFVTAGGKVQALDGDGHSLCYRASAGGQIELADWLRTKGSRETIFDAVARNDRQAVESFLDRDHGSLVATNRNGTTPLLAAAIAGSDDLVWLLLARGAKLTDHTSGGWSLLHISAARNSMALGRRGLEAGLDPNELALGGLGPLHLAAAYGHTEFAELLLEHGANPSLCPPEDPRWSGNSPLHWAATKGHAATVRVLLAHGANPTIANRARLTPAMNLRGTPFRSSWGFITPPGLRAAFSTLSDEATRQEILALLDAAAAEIPSR